MKAKNQSLLLIDAIAIILIVFFHSLLYSPYSIFILGPLGLWLFSFSAGYKLMYNHGQELQDEAFLKQYMVRRFKRLYKPYIGYTLLVLPFLYAVSWIGKNLFGLNYSGLSRLDESTGELIWNFMIGENPVAYQLWYLVILIGITFICFLVLYLFNSRVLFVIAFAVSILYIFFHNTIESLFVIRVVECGVSFIAGMFFATRIAFPEKIAVPLLAPLLIIGSYSFYIFLFQWPFLIPVPGRVLFDIFHVSSIFVPIMLTAFTIAASIVIYRLMKALGINRIFE